ncbi:hypothetical protein K2173_026255 [Erythroxylum novogranatense]|uniref:Pectinesterase n=1 Tax=Erythroxylum novogranatense TaxID=1862640 RepID=A0AAV8SBJ9_9ROSI|nr:hypothetical protein K2173_026255 [Erythroxylum novogranatense]
MASKLFFLIPISLSLLLPFYSTPCLGDVPPSPSSPVSPRTLCKTLPDPSYCKSVLPNQTANVFEYGRFSVRKSLSQTRKFLKLVEKYLNHRSTLSTGAVRALQDCEQLATLNIDFLLSSYQTLGATNSTLGTVKADDVQTFLSAIITNVQTCLDGIQTTASDWSIKNGISVPLSNDTKLFSVSLALFTKAWVPKRSKRRITMELTSEQQKFRDGNLQLFMSSRARSIYESVSRSRKLLQKTTVGNNSLLVSDMVTVSKKKGVGNFTNINDAIAAAPNNTDGTNGYFMVYVKAGLYNEYVSIPKNKNYLMMVGDGIHKTIMVGNRSVADNWTTFNSATFAVVAPNFVAVNITFRNTAGAIKHQAVAVRNGADLSTFYRCSFEGYQDTLYAHSLRQFYRECDIYGTVDFIFGNAAAVFQNCNIYPLQPMNGQFNAITAQGRTDPNQNTGTSIQNCTIKAAHELASSNYTVQTFLGRPWKNYSRTVIMQSSLDKYIDPAGWQIWDGDFALSTLYYAEYNNRGKGSNTTNRVKWPGYHIINATEASNFTVANFLDGDVWIRQTLVPYSSGLV